QLASDDRLRVIEQPGAILIEPANPQYVYVPYYDPWIAYGPWWWPAYPPIGWAPWPGYVRAYRPGFNIGFWWGAPIGLSAGFFFGAVDWPRRHVRVARVDNYYVRPAIANRQLAVTPGRWRHDYWQRRDFARADPVARPQFTAPAPLRDQRREEQRREERRTFAGPRVQAAPQLSAPQFSAPRSEAPRAETRQSLQRPIERQRDVARAERQPEPRRFEQRQAMPPAASAAPRMERREQRVERREQRVEQRHDHAKGAQRALN
ncbi:MAG: DUF3300 domain-containing protein, partial [Burkholderiales bacterium]